MALIVDVFPKLRTPPKKFRFRGPSKEQHSKRVQTLLKSEQQHIYDISLPL